MRIAIDTLPLLSPLTGVGNYISQLVRQFNLLSPKTEYIYYYGYFSKELPQSTDHAGKVKKLLWTMPPLRYGLRQANILFSRFHLKEFDLYFEPNFMPLNIRAKRVVTTVHDFSFLLYADSQPKDRVRYFQKHFMDKVNRSSRIITDSVYIKNEALHFLKVPPSSVTVIPLGVEHDIFRIYDRSLSEACKYQFKLPERFILFVGTKEPRKNLASLIRAYSELPVSIRRRFKLLMVGPAGPAVKESRPSDDIIQMEYVDTRQLALLYNLATVFVLPSHYEGFGLPPLEAMASGCPVVVSKTASLPEVCGDAAYYVDPKDVDSIAEGMIRVLSDEALRRSLVTRGLERAKLFTWEKTARKTLDVFEEVMGMKA